MPKCFVCRARGVFFFECRRCAAGRERLGVMFLGQREIPIDLWDGVDPSGRTPDRGGYDVWLGTDSRPALLTFNPKHRAEAMSLVGRVVDQIIGYA